MTLSALALSGVSIATENGDVVHDVNLTVASGTVHALVGESGSGKTLTALSILRLLPRGVQRSAGAVMFTNNNVTHDLAALSDAALRRIRGRHISMIFQEPMTALNPLMRAIDQVAEPLRIHYDDSASVAREKATALLVRMGLDATRVRAYPHELSGGQRQRVMTAIAIAAEPRFVIADEPTASLDTATQTQVLNLLSDLVAERQLGLLFITHDLGIVETFASVVSVMHGGRIVETGATADIFARPSHPYTQSLLAARLLGC